MATAAAVLLTSAALDRNYMVEGRVGVERGGLRQERSQRNERPLDRRAQRLLVDRRRGLRLPRHRLHLERPDGRRRAPEPLRGHGALRLAWGRCQGSQAARRLGLVERHDLAHGLVVEVRAEVREDPRVERDRRPHVGRCRRRSRERSSSAAPSRAILFLGAVERCEQVASIEVAERLALALGVSTSDLLGGGAEVAKNPNRPEDLLGVRVAALAKKATPEQIDVFARLAQTYFAAVAGKKGRAKKRPARG